MTSKTEQPNSEGSPRHKDGVSTIVDGVVFRRSCFSCVYVTQRPDSVMMCPLEEKFDEVSLSSFDQRAQGCTDYMKPPGLTFYMCLQRWCDNNVVHGMDTDYARKLKDIFTQYAIYPREGSPNHNNRVPIIVTPEGRKELKSCVMCTHSRWRYDSFSCIRKAPMYHFSEASLRALAGECEHYSWTGVPYPMAKDLAWKITITPPEQDGEEEMVLIWPRKTKE